MTVFWLPHQINFPVFSVCSVSLCSVLQDANIKQCIPGLSYFQSPIGFSPWIAPEVDKGAKEEREVTILMIPSPCHGVVSSRFHYPQMLTRDPISNFISETHVGDKTIKHCVHMIVYIFIWQRFQHNRLNSNFCITCVCKYF